MTTLISGDLSFFYDANGLWNDNLPQNLRIIVINNGGGNIFKIIEGPSKTGVVEEAFEAPHTRSVQKLTELNNLEHSRAANITELLKGMQWLYSGDSCKVLEVYTVGGYNEEAVKEYFTFLGANS
ncbi:MAG: hypothetical protein HKN32_08275 [Flavobacteriales bacterium]|nr:hypothetical protein [Flavobacteriales bacterium]